MFYKLLTYSISLSPLFSDNDETLLIIQCDSGHLYGDLIACARYRIDDEREKAKLRQYGSTHVLFIINLPRQKGSSSFVGFQGGSWLSAHIDDIRPPPESALTLNEALSAPISQLFYSGTFNDNSSEREEMETSFPPYITEVHSPYNEGNRVEYSSNDDSSSKEGSNDSISEEESEHSSTVNENDLSEIEDNTESITEYPAEAISFEKISSTSSSPSIIDHSTESTHYHEYTTEDNTVLDDAVGEYHIDSTNTSGCLFEYTTEGSTAEYPIEGNTDLIREDIEDHTSEGSTEEEEDQSSVQSLLFDDVQESIEDPSFMNTSMTSQLDEVGNFQLSKNSCIHNVYCTYMSNLLLFLISLFVFSFFLSLIVSLLLLSILDG